MRISYTGQVSPSVSSVYLRAMSALMSEITDALDHAPLSEIEINISVCPVIVTNEFEEVFLAKTRFNKKSKILYVHSKIDLQAFQTCSDQERRRMLLLMIDREVGEQIRKHSALQELSQLSIIFNELLTYN